MQRTFLEKINAVRKLYNERLLPWAKAVIKDWKDIFLDKNNNPMQPHLIPPQINLTPESKKVFSEMQQNSLSILVWRNNSWKSLLLNSLKVKIWSWANIIYVNRYQNFSVISEFSPNENEREQLHNSFMQQSQQPQNSENVLVWLSQIFGKLHGDKLDTLYELIEKFFDIKMEPKNIQEWYPFSQKYLNCNGVNLAYMSSGFRLCLYLLAAMLDDKFSIFIIDEPELGISPELQWNLADLLLNKENREKYFPHVKQLILATHSTIFLDSQVIGNNYMIKKNGNEISIQKTANISELRNIHFFLLGNRFETLSLPSAIVLVEWKTDKQFINFVFAKRFPNKKISVQFGDWKKSDQKEWWDGHIVSLGRKIAETLDIQSSPYKTRTFVVLDKKNSTKKWTLETYWFEKDNIIEFPENGIEYYYPAEIIDEIFWKEWKLEIDGDFVKKGDISKTKDQLCNEVLSKINDKSKYHDAFEAFLTKIGKAIWI